MLSRRSVFGSLAAFVATLPFTRRAFGAVEDPRAIRGTGFGNPADDLAPPFLVREEWLDMDLDGKPTPVHCIHMQVDKSVDPGRGIVMMFNIPKGRKVLADPDGLQFPGDPDGVLFLPVNRRIIVPIYEFDVENGVVVGESRPGGIGPWTNQVYDYSSPQTRLAEIIKAAETHGFSTSTGFTGGHVLWIIQNGPTYKRPKHGMVCLPYKVTLDDMEVIVPLRMTRASVIRV